jgi:glycosyltransferase involved in cell wall biosynthesis
MVSKLWPPRAVGGAERYAEQLAQHLEAAGHEVGVVTFGVDSDRVVASVPTRGVDPERWWVASSFVRRRSHVVDLWNPDTRRVLRQAVDTFRPDVVHSHAVAGMSVAALLANAPRVHTVHDHWLLCWRGSPMRDGDVCASTCATCMPYLLSRRTIVGRRPPLFIAPVDHVRAAHVGKGWDPDRWRVVRHPVEPPPEPIAPARAPVHAPVTGPLRLGYLGQLSPDKGVDLLLDALADLGDGVRLVVAGEGPLDDVARRTPAVEHRGRVGGADKERFFADVDVLVVPSRVPEVSPLVLDEAAVRRVPVIGSRRGGIPECVAPVCRPLLFDPGVPGDLVRAVERYADDPAAYVVEPPTDRTWDQHVRAIVRVYEEARAEAVTTRATAPPTPPPTTPRTAGGGG